MCPDLLCESDEQKPESSSAIGAGTADETTAAAAKGQKFSDAELTRSALAAIGRDAPMVAGKVRLVVRNGWLILDGEVTEPLHRRAAENAVRNLDGIRGLSNNILIESETTAQRVSQKIDEAFALGARLSAHRVSVTARDHVVVLSGFVRNGVEREEAEAAAWAVPGVAQVINRIRTA
jgi:osmotically-inducible protein OsmY